MFAFRLTPFQVCPSPHAPDAGPRLRAGTGAASSPGPRFPPGGGFGLCSELAVGGGWRWGPGAQWRRRGAWGAGGSLEEAPGDWSRGGVSGRGPRAVRWLACPELAASACFVTGESTSFFRRTHCSKRVGGRGEAGALRTSNREGTPVRDRLSGPQWQGPWWVRLGCEWCHRPVF